MGGKANAARPVALSPRRSRVSRASGPALLLGAAALAARLGGAGAACVCPEQAVCTVADLVLEASEFDTIAATSCALDAAGHLEADLHIERNVALAPLDLSALASVGGSLNVFSNPALASIDLRRLAAVGSTFSITNNDDAHHNHGNNKRNTMAITEPNA